MIAPNGRLRRLLAFWKTLMIRYKSYVFIGLFILLTLKVFIPQLDDLKDSLAALKDANLTWMAAGLIIFFLGVPALAIQMVVLALKKLSLILTFRVEMAGLFITKLLPAGVGMISLNMYYLIKSGHKSGQAATVMTANAITSAIAYIILIIASLMLSPISLQGMQGSLDLPLNLILFIIILLLGAGYMLYHSAKFQNRIKSTWSDMKANFGSYKTKRLALVVGVLCNGFGSAANVFALYASAQAIGVNLSFTEALLAYSFGNIAATLVPTPGGLGATEAGLYSGLVFTGVDGSNAIVITLLYRLITYWLPIIPGYIYFWHLRKNVLSKFSLKYNSSNAT